jgi:hypothetical protein
MVLGACKKSPSVSCWQPPETNLTLAFFLQYHDDEERPLGPETAMVRMAYRNYRPEPLKLRRRLSAAGAVLGDYEEQEVLTLLSAKDDGSIEAVHPRAVDVERTSTNSAVTAKVVFTEPKGFARAADIPPFVMQFPERGRDAKCPCCSQLFPT